MLRPFRHEDQPRAVVERADLSTPWAVQRSTLSEIAALMRREYHADQAREMRALIGDQQQPRTAGAVAVLSLRGLITPRPSYLSMLFGGGGGLESFRSNFRDALDNDDVASILLDIDSPGGSTALVAETADEIRAARGTKPIVAIANTLAASAAYWIAAQADELVVTPSGMVGSIGVYYLHTDVSKLEADLGITTSLVSAGRFKVEGNEHEPLSDEARAALQANVDDFYSLFVAGVAAGRGVSEQTVREGYGEGRVLPAGRALDAGMVDSIETAEQVVSRLITAPGAATATGRQSSAAAFAAIAQRTAALEAQMAAQQEHAAAASATAADALADPGTGDADPDPSTTPPAGREDDAAPSQLPAWLFIPTPHH